MNISFNSIGIVGIAVGIVGFGYGIYRDNKANKMAEKIGLSVSEVESKAQIDVDQAIVNKAIQNAVERKVSAATAEAIKSVRSDIQDEISSRVRKSVDAEYQRLTEDVTEKISEQVANIDEYALQDKVVQKAQAIVVKKTESSVNGVLNDFNTYLNDIKKFYDGVTRIISPNQSNVPEVPRLRFTYDR